MTQLSVPALQTSAMKVSLVACATAFHAALLVCTATGFTQWLEKLPGKTIPYYEALTGADNTFSFFAPHVASQAYTEVVTTKYDGSVSTRVYGSARTEGELRVVAFSLSMQQQGLYDLLAYSLAANALKAKGAKEVVVRLGYYQIPRLEEASKPAAPKILYVGKYVHPGGTNT